jgi:AraC-like DNA-binding protein
MGAAMPVVSKSTDAAEAPARPPVLVLSGQLALTSAPTAGVHLFERCSPVHSVLLGRCHLQIRGLVQTPSAIAVPANTPHRVLAFEGPHACVAYLDARRYRFQDAERLARVWRGFVPGRDDLREAAGDARKTPERRIDPRLTRALEALGANGLSVAEAAAQVGLSESRLTHLMTESIGAPPRSWRAWLRLQRALGEALFGPANLTDAAHRAGFADSAHLTRTCKQLTGVRPAQMLPKTVYVSEDGRFTRP